MNTKFENEYDIYDIIEIGLFNNLIKGEKKLFCLKCGTELKKKGKILTCPNCKTAYTAEVKDGEETLTEYIEPRGFSNNKHIMFVILGAVLAVIVAIVGITTGVSVSRSQSVAREFEIAERYLSELNYEQAVIEFKNILEIEPMNVEAYLGLAKAYVGLGDTEKALETLRKGYELTNDERLQDMIDELESADEPPVSSSVSSSSSETSEPEATTLLNLEDENFRIVNGVLEKYLGSGGDVIIPDGVITIGDYAFYRCDSLTSVVIPNSVTSIDTEAFSCCRSLTSITIPDSVTTISYWVFGGCEALTSIDIGNGVTDISFNAFTDTPWLKNQTDEFVIVGDGVLLDYNGNGGDVVIPSNVKYISDAFGACSSLTSITIPDSVTVIGADAFASCTSLTNVVIPESVTEIGSLAFCNCTSLTNITIPDSVTKIVAVEGWSTFRGCLTNATYKGVTYSYENIDDLYKAINGN